VTGDESRAGDEIDLLSGTFVRVEATAFGRNGHTPDLTAFLIALTPSDGHEASRVVRTRPEDEPSVRALAERLEEALRGTEGRDLRLAAIARVLKSSIAVEPAAG
jgi:hypothetical protein